MTDHLAADQLERFVRGELTGAPRAELEAHVASCEACAARLADEARVELVLVELAADHVAADQLELFVQGELTGAALAQLETHLAGCEACAALVAAEARVELALIDLAATPAVAVAAPAPAPGRTGARAWRRRITAAIAALAVVVLVWLRRADPPDEPTPGPVPDVLCAVRSEQAACVARAHRHGLYVQYPSWAGPPPLAGGRLSATPSVSPFASEAEAEAER